MPTPSKSSPCVGIRTCSDYSPFGVELDGRTVSGGYRFGYQGSEKDNEFKGNGNSYTTEFRQLDPRLGRWLSVDPKKSKTPWESTYVSMGNKPITFCDPLGDEIIIGEDFKNNKTNSRALKEMVNTEVGKEFLAKYAKAGQVIGGYEFKTDGEFHNQGIDLEYVNGGKEPGNNQEGGGGNTSHTRYTEIHNGKQVAVGAKIIITVWEGKGWATDNWTFNRIMTLFHESFIHAALKTEDYLDNKLFDHSNITESDKDRAGGIQVHYQHRHVMNEYEKDVLNNNLLWPNQALTGLMKIANDWNLSYSREELQMAMWNFNGGYSGGTKIVNDN